MSSNNLTDTKIKALKKVGKAKCRKSRKCRKHS